MFDPITATPAQLTAQIWHLTEQYACTLDVFQELEAIDYTDPKLNELYADAVEIRIQLDLIERLDRLCDRDLYYETDTMSMLRSYASSAGHLDCDIDTFKRVLITLGRQGFTIVRKEQLAA